MILQQVSVFVENKAGQLAEVTKLLADNGIDLRALNIAEAADYGVLRLIVSDPEKASALLQASERPVNLTKVVAAAVPDRPGGLNEVLTLLSEESVNVSYMYSIFGHKNGQAHMIFRVNDPERTEELLGRCGLQTGSVEELGVY